MDTKLVAEARTLCSSLEDIHRRMIDPDGDFESVNDYRIDQVENLLVQAYRRYERRMRLLLLDEN